MSEERDPAFEGVHMSRRAALHGSAALPAMWMLNSAARRADTGLLADDVQTFLSHWAERTLEVVAQDEPNEEAHLLELVAGLARIDPEGLPERTKISFEDESMKSGPMFARPSFIVLQFDMQAGASILPHNHVGWSFVSMGLRGEATVRHFEPEGVPPDPGTELKVEFPVREVASTLLTRGRCSSLTRTRANIHGFRAGEEGATFIDFGIQYPNPGGGYEAFSALEIDEEARDVARRVYSARWIGNPYK
jgi:hypothetical protein